MKQGGAPLKRAKPRLTYANVTATLALFLALGGGAYAAHQLPKRSVGARQLRPGAVTARKLRKNAVTAPKLRAEAVKGAKLARAAVTNAKLAVQAVSAEKLAPGAVTTAKIAPDAVTGVQVNEASLAQVPSAASADYATFAASADPAAFAAVGQEGDVDPSLSKGGVAVREGIEAGIYCVRVPGFAPRGAQVTLRYNGSGNATAYLTIGGSQSCPAPEVEVQTYNGGSLVKEPFYIVLYR